MVCNIDVYTDNTQNKYDFWGEMHRSALSIKASEAGASYKLMNKLPKMFN